MKSEKKNFFQPFKAQSKKTQVLQEMNNTTTLYYGMRNPKTGSLTTMPMVVNKRDRCALVEFKTEDTIGHLTGVLGATAYTFLHEAQLNKTKQNAIYRLFDERPHQDSRMDFI